MELPVNIYPEREIKQAEHATIDRFEGEWAVLILENGQELTVNRDQLPAAAEEGDWLYVELQDGQLYTVIYDESSTVAAKERIATKIERLKRGEHLR